MSNEMSDVNKHEVADHSAAGTAEIASLKEKLRHGTPVDAGPTS